MSQEISKIVDSTTVQATNLRGTLFYSINQKWSRSFHAKKTQIEAWFLGDKQDRKNSEKDLTNLSFLRLLMGVSGFLIALATLILAVGDSFLDRTSRVAIFSLTSFFLISIIAALRFLKAHKDSQARNIIAITIFVTVVSAIQLTGGLQSSVAAPMILVVPVFHFCFFTTKRAFTAAICVPIVSYSLSAINTEYKLGIPNITSQANPEFNSAIVLACLYVAIILTLFSLLSGNAMLRTALRNEKRQLQRLANLDHLTGLANGRMFRQRLDSYCEQAEKAGRQIAVFYLDLDDFKSLNDKFGHEVGDEILISIAKRLQPFSKIGYFTARLGGDEFAIVADNILHEAHAAEISLNILHAIQAPFRINGNDTHVTASIGQCLYPSSGIDRHALLATSDLAMYQQKNARRHLKERSSVSQVKQNVSPNSVTGN